MRVAALLLAMLVSTSCAPKGLGSGVGAWNERAFAVSFREDSSHFRGELPASVDSVWRILPIAFESLHFPGEPSVYPKDRVYLTPSMKIEQRLYPDEPNSRYVNCGFTTGGQPIADVYRLTFAMVARLLPQTGGGTTVDIIIDGTAQNMVERMLPVHCTGSGKLEAVVFSILEDSLRARR